MSPILFGAIVFTLGCYVLAILTGAILEKFRGQAPAVTAFGTPESAKGIDPMFPAL